MRRKLIYALLSASFLFTSAYSITTGAADLSAAPVEELGYESELEEADDYDEIQEIEDGVDDSLENTEDNFEIIGYAQQDPGDDLVVEDLIVDSDSQNIEIFNEEATSFAEEDDGWTQVIISNEEYNIFYKLTEDGTLELKKGSEVTDKSTALKNFGNFTIAKVQLPWKASFSSIKKLVVGDGITQIGQYNFAKQVAPNLEEVVFNGDFSNGLTIGKQAFLNTGSLTKVTGLEKVTVINSQAFKGTGLTDITLGNVSIGGSAFADCSALKSITGKNIILSADSSFQNCPKLIKIEFQSISTDETCYGSFSLCPSLTSFTCNTIDSIPQTAFDSDEALAQLQLNGVQKIGEGAFVRCTALKHICFDGTRATWAELVDGIDTGLTEDVAVHCKADSVVAKEATCEEDGYGVAGTCPFDGEYAYPDENSIPALGHTWKAEANVDKEATCTEAGRKSIHCEVCDAIKEGSVEEIPAGHTWKAEATVDKEATCTEAGSKSIHCAVCNAIKEGSTETIPAKGHQWGEWTTVSEATGTSGEKQERICSVCGQKETQELPVAEGQTATLSASNAVVSVTGKNTVTYTAPADSTKKTVNIPEKVEVGGKTYTVTAIAANAFKNDTKVKNVTIPKTVKKIGKNAFYKCKNLKKITIKSKKLTKKNIGKNAFKGISTKAVIKVPKGKKTAYKKLFRAKGLSKKVTIK